MAQSVHPIFPASSWFAVATAAMWRGGTSAASAADVLRHYGRCYWELFKARLGCTAAQWRILEENQGQTQSQRLKPIKACPVHSSLLPPPPPTCCGTTGGATRSSPKPASVMFVSVVRVL